MTYLGPQFPIDADHDAENHGSLAKPVSQRAQEKISRSGIPHFDEHFLQDESANE